MNPEMKQRGTLHRLNPLSGYIKLIPGPESSLVKRAGIVTIKYSLKQMRWRVATMRSPDEEGGAHPVSGIRE